MDKLSQEYQRIEALVNLTLNAWSAEARAAAAAAKKALRGSGKTLQEQKSHLRNILAWGNMRGKVVAAAFPHVQKKVSFLMSQKGNRDRNDFDDVVQTSILKAFSSYKPESGASFRSFAETVAGTTVLDYGRSKRARAKIGTTGVEITPDMHAPVKGVSEGTRDAARSASAHAIQKEDEALVRKVKSAGGSYKKARAALRGAV